jgi:hypothetical protein
VYTAVIASRAAKAADGQPDDRSGPRGASGPSFEEGAIMGAFSDRVMTIIGWIVAVAACGATALLLVSIAYGYVLAMHHRLPPNTTFGFRDSTTRSCRSAWYAAQKAGFSWLLFGGGPLLTLNVLVCMFAAIKRRSPWDVYVTSMAVLSLLIIVVVVAGIHADGAARAVIC